MLYEIAKNESGEIIWEEPYPFRRLFKEGQEQVVDGQRYVVISCERCGKVVQTVVRAV